MIGLGILDVARIRNEMGGRTLKLALYRATESVAELWSVAAHPQRWRSSNHHGVGARAPSPVVWGALAANSSARRGGTAHLIEASEVTGPVGEGANQDGRGHPWSLDVV